MLSSRKSLQISLRYFLRFLSVLHYQNHLTLTARVMKSKLTHSTHHQLKVLLFKCSFQYCPFFKPSFLPAVWKTCQQCKVCSQIMRKTTLKVWCFQPDSKKIVPVYMNACGLQMNARKFRQLPWVWHIWTLLMWQTHPSGAPCRIKQTLRVICSSYLNFFFIGGIL